jgi:predicted ATP-dependent serine protease
VGEVGLTGGVRPAPGAALRLAAAVAAGADTVFLAGEASPPSGIRIVPVRHVRDALTWAASTPARAPLRRASAEAGARLGGRTGEAPN